MSSARLDATQRLSEIVDSFAGKRVVVLGDLVSDEFVYADIARVSREAPVLILDHTRTEVVPGGAGNTAVNLRALGARPIPVGVVGRDFGGESLVEEFRRRRIPISGIRRASGYATPCKSRILAGGIHTRRQQIVRLDRGSHRGELNPGARERIVRAAQAALRDADGLIVADYGYGAAVPEIVASCAATLLRRGIPWTVDSRSRVSEYRGATACTPNQEELEQSLSVDSLEDSEVFAAGRKLLRRSGNRAVLVTRGARGMSLIERGRPPVHIPAYGSDEVADVTGAGDTVIAAFSLGLLTGAALADAARLANYAAGLVVTKAGTATVSGAELIGAVKEDAPG